jgi:beta-amylase
MRPPLFTPIQAGQNDPDIFFTDRPRHGSGLGQRNKEYISFWADEEPVLLGRTPMQVRLG